MASTEIGAYSRGGGEPVPYDEQTGETETETFEEAEQQGPSERWVHWQAEIKASLAAEHRWREEGREAERAYFGEDEKAFTTSDYQKDEHQTNIIHANIEVLKPLVFSDKPDPIVRRRFGGDGENDPTDRVAALVAQRLAEFLIDTSGFMSAMELARDDWLIPGRGLPRVLYAAEFEPQPVTDPATGLPVLNRETGEPFTIDRKTRESVKVRHWPWSRTMFSATNSWDEVRWAAFETPMTKAKVEKRFGADKAAATTYPINGLKGTDGKDRVAEMAGYEPDSDEETSKTQSVTAHDQCVVFEIWDKESRKVIWWSPHFRDDVLDVIDDPLGLEDFFNCPKPLLAASKGGMLTPRPDTAFYRARAEEIDTATKKLHGILEAISVSGAYPGALVTEMKKLLDGKNKMIAIAEWTAYLEKAGSGGNIIQWLPLDIFVQAATALIQMREQAKQQLYEISGIADIMRGQTDPNETLGAQQLKGNYANLRLRDKQAKMHRCCRDTIQIMVEVAVEHFDTETIIAIVNLTLPRTDAELEQMIVAQQQAEMQHAAMAQQAQEMGRTPPPPPTFPFFEKTSWERVHASLRDDMTRKFSLSIETDGTILADQEEDKKARVEFLQAFAQMVEVLFPMAQSGIVEMKTIKELLMFAVRGFPKSRTLEGMLAAIPDQINTEPPKDPSVTVAEIRATTDKAIAEMKFGAEAEAKKSDQQHDTRMAGFEALTDAFLSTLESQNRQIEQHAKPKEERPNG